MPLITPVILSGGTGTRLWPLSRQAYPKQLLALAGERTLLAEAALRAVAPPLFGPMMVIANAEHRFAVGEQLAAAGIADARIVLEPVGRNTGPAVAVAALLAHADDKESVLLIMPSDHVVTDVAGFHAAFATGLPAARDGALVLFGIRPSRAETGYGYIRVGAAIERAPGVLAVAGFVEKPDAARAAAYVAAGHLWNSGIFLLPAAAVIAALERFEPAIVAAARAAIAGARRDLDFLRLGEAAFAGAPAISIDRAVMERTDRAAVVPADFGWSDAGTWTGLWEIGDRDGEGNVRIGDVTAQGTRNSYLRTDGPLLATLGVEDLVVVATDDAVLVARRGADQDVSKLVETLRAAGVAAATESLWVHRPWGSYRTLHRGDRFLVKRISVKPGARLSLQKHAHRAEHWVVVNGEALVTRGTETMTVRENESIFLPQGTVHRLENRTNEPLNLIEVQSGAYLGEDDIVRLEDDYAR